VGYYPTVVPQLPDYAPTGLTGATAVSRYAGATARGAPASGTFAVGDFIIDQTGSIWICTTAGSPGTWTNPADVPWGQAAPAGFTPSNPTATASTTLVMMGFGAAATPVLYTPAGSGLVVATFTGFACTNTAVATCTVGARYGTGTAPANGAAVTGSRFGAVGDQGLRFASTIAPVGFTYTGLLSLTPGTQYWFDAAVSTSVAPVRPVGA
jgi:hypothetical protein